MKLLHRWAPLLLLVTALSSCTRQEPQQKPPKKFHTLRMNISREPTTMDPRQGSELVGSTLHFMLFEGLVRLNPDNSITPAQAQSIEISDDRKTYIFHLRKTKWSDGTRVVAADFENAWKKILTPNFPAANAHLLYPIKNAEKAKRGVVPLDQVGIRAPDSKTLVVELENPTPYFLDLISFCVFFPVSHTVDETDPAWMQEASSHFISNGPFRLVSWKHHNELVLEKNPYYWEAPQIDLDKIQISMVSDENTVLNMYKKNELDIMGLGISPLPKDALLQYQQWGELKTYSIPATTILCFNVNRFPFDNKNIRKAFAYAVNRKEIVDNITQLEEEVATNIIPSGLKYNPHLSYFQDNNIKRAQKLFRRGLEELHITPQEFPVITYYYSHDSLNHKLAQALQQQWSKILGVKVHLEQSDHKVFLDRLKNRNYDLAQSFWFAQYNDPLSILERFKYQANAKNYCGWENPEYIRLLEKSYTDATEEERMKTLKTAEALFMEEMPLTPLYHWKSAFMIKDHLDYKEFPADGFFELTRISVKK
ncbi:MAG: peptide ABC transporter substrate-binding protein [Verrucomicrobia bacterium]|nr:peptide ABC transporter substrate-binding protein [Verrucomicrobiota bacterium]